jgi:pyridoxine 5-phosphate synthase
MRLGVNIDHVATLRQSRGGLDPEPTFAALIAESSGADAIVVHLREDRRHIQDADLFILRRIIRTKLNLEMSISPDIVRVAIKVRPDQATLVPEKREELTTEGGLNVTDNRPRIAKAIRDLERKDVRVSLFIDPDKSQIKAARSCGARMIEIHTGRYANASDKTKEKKELNIIRESTKFAKGIGLTVFAGHGLNYCNVFNIVKIKEIEELNIGHSIISRAIFVGLGQAVKEMKEIIS